MHKQSSKSLQVSHLEIANALNKALSQPLWENMAQPYGVCYAHPSEYGPDQGDLFAANWLRQNILAKSVEADFSGLVSCREAAQQSFVDAEDMCARTNLRLRTTSPNWRVAAVIARAASKIERVLGEFVLDELPKGSRFSGGASTTRRRAYAHAAHKYGESISRSVTPSCYAYAVAMVKHSPVWERRLTQLHGSDPAAWFMVRASNRIAFVPKNAKTDRTIAIENDMNMYVQLGIGAMLRRRLKRVGVDLDSQCKNQVLAKDGSITGKLATIDLSSASDSVTLEAVRLLLPSDWFIHMDRVRSHLYEDWNGAIKRYHKISSMGNGFTFELESLIFWGVAKACSELAHCVDHRVAIYGDDIIVGTEAVDLLAESLAYLGFKFNDDKSFSTGLFRESCGKHYFNGRDVTPFYLRASVNSAPAAYRIANRIREWAWRYDCCSSENLFSVWQQVVHRIPKRLRLFIPEGYGDTGIKASLSEAHPRIRHGITTVKQVCPVIQRFSVVSEGAYLFRLASPGEGLVKVRKNRQERSRKVMFNEDLYDLSRAIPDRYVCRRLIVSSWEDPYPWLVTSDSA